MEQQSIFEKATRLGLEFQINVAINRSRRLQLPNASVYDVWNLTVEQLQELGENLANELPDAEKENTKSTSIFKNNAKSKALTLDEERAVLRHDIVAHIYTVKAKERELSQNKAQKKAELQAKIAKVQDALAAKEDAALSQTSHEDLMKTFAEMQAELKKLSE